MLNYFLDTEFNENGETIELISIGVVCEDGRQFYRVSTEFNPDGCNEWVKQNVLTHLPERTDPAWATRAQIRDEFLRFVTVGPEKPRFWGWFADYDWIVVCQLFGRMIDLPPSLPQYCMDLKQYAEMIGAKREAFPKQDGTLHDALQDAIWNREVYRFLRGRPQMIYLRRLAGDAPTDDGFGEIRDTVARYRRPEHRGNPTARAYVRDVGMLIDALKEMK